MNSTKKKEFILIKLEILFNEVWGKWTGKSNTMKQLRKEYLPADDFLRSKHVENIVTCFSDFRREVGSVSRFIGYSPGGTTINYNTILL
jgi:hypothetical protein